MDSQMLLAVAGFILPTGTTIFFVGRFVGSLRRDMEVNEKIHAEQHTTNILRIEHVSSAVLELKESSVEKRDELRRTLEQQLAAMTVEITRLRDDRHNTTGMVMRHEGVLGEIRKDVVALDSRITRVEDIQRIRRTDYPPSPGPS